MNAIIYTATNRIDGKVYVGKTTQTLASRIAQHKNRAKDGGRPFQDAIAKFGVNGFYWAVVQECDNEIDANKAEAEWIKTLGSFADTGHGYNKTLGGAGSVGHNPNQESRAKLSKSLRVTNMAKGRGGRRQQSMFHPKLGIKHRPESIEMIRKSMMGKRNNVKLSDSDLVGIVERRRCGQTQETIAQAYGVNRATISYALKRSGASV